MQYKKITLRRGKEESLKRFHPWVFSGAIASADDTIEEGDLVSVFGSDGTHIGNGHFQVGSIINVGTISCIISLWVSFARPVFPMFISSALDYLGALPTSLSMIVIGASLTEIPLKELFTDKRLLAFSALKLLVIPIAGLMAVKPFVREQDLLAVVMVMLATPVASMVVMIAQQHDADYRTAAKGLSLTTLLSVLTIPLVSLIMGI